MKKRVAGILEFVNRSQEESARVPGSLGGDEKEKNGTGEGDENAKEEKVAEVTVNGASAEPDFASLDTTEMLKELKARLVQWEDEYGRWPRA